jgi:hypothetical protein
MQAALESPKNRYLEEIKWEVVQSLRIEKLAEGGTPRAAGGREERG